MANGDGGIHLGVIGVPRFSLKGWNNKAQGIALGPMKKEGTQP